MHENPGSVIAARTNFTRIWIYIALGFAGNVALLILLLWGLYRFFPGIYDTASFFILLVPNVLFFFFSRRAIRNADIIVDSHVTDEGIMEQPREGKHAPRLIKWKQIEDMRELYNRRLGNKPYFRIKVKGSTQAFVVRSYVCGAEAYSGFVQAVKEGVMQASGGGHR